MCDLLREKIPRGRGIRFHPICLTSGNAVSRGGRDHMYPRKISSGWFKFLLQGKRLKIARELPLADVLVKELLNFQVKITLAAHRFRAHGGKANTMIWFLPSA